MCDLSETKRRRHLSVTELGLRLIQTNQFYPELGDAGGECVGVTSYKSCRKVTEVSETRQGLRELSLP